MGEILVGKSQVDLKDLFFVVKLLLGFNIFYIVCSKGGVEDTTFEAKDTKKSEAKAKDRLLEDRPSRGQGRRT